MALHPQTNLARVVIVDLGATLMFCSLKNNHALKTLLQAVILLGIIFIHKKKLFQVFNCCG